jgi:hypothetical protein
MKEIKLYFLTLKGEAAYNQINEIGKKQSYWDRRIAKAFCKETRIQEKPLIVLLKFASPRVAEALQIQIKIYEQLEDQGAKQDIDYKMEVI